MTTIAADLRSGQMAADSMMSDGDTKTTTVKIVRFKDELIGAAGACPDIALWMKWYCGGRKGRKPKTGEAAALVMRPGSLSLFTGTDETPIDRGFHAIGSGGKAAMALLVAGFDVKRAVEVVIEVDPHSGPPIQVETISG